MDSSHLQFLTTRRDTERAAMEAAWDIAQTKWDELQALNERVARGVAYIGEHPEDAKARGLLATLKRDRDALARAHEWQLSEFRRLEEIYLLSVRSLRFHGVYEEDSTGKSA